jgi:hypothetical protein
MADWIEGAGCRRGVNATSMLFQGLRYSSIANHRFPTLNFQ